MLDVQLTANRFMSIAEQMGRTLQKTAISTNIKERLDFSCALFSPDGGLVRRSLYEAHFDMMLTIFVGEGSECAPHSSTFGFNAVCCNVPAQKVEGQARGWRCFGTFLALSFADPCLSLIGSRLRIIPVAVVHISPTSHWSLQCLNDQEETKSSSTWPVEDIMRTSVVFCPGLCRLNRRICGRKERCSREKKWSATGFLMKSS